MSGDFLHTFKQTLLNTHPENFEQKALALFRYQAEHNIIYRQYLSHLRVNTQNIQSIRQIPFLPIELFKSQQVVTGHPEIQVIFESSGTTGQTPSRHFVADTDFYNELSQQIFEQFYQPLNQCHILVFTSLNLTKKLFACIYGFAFY